jgi:hypothetical protein
MSSKDFYIEKFIEELYLILYRLDYPSSFYTSPHEKNSFTLKSRIEIPEKNVTIGYKFTLVDITDPTPMFHFMRRTLDCKIEMYYKVRDEGCMKFEKENVLLTESLSFQISEYEKKKPIDIELVRIILWNFAKFDKLAENNDFGYMNFSRF